MRDGLQFAKAKEARRSFEWELERLYKRVYGHAEPQVNIAGNDLRIEIVKFTDEAAIPGVAERLIDRVEGNRGEVSVTRENGGGQQS